MTPIDALKKVTAFTQERIANNVLMRKEVRGSGDIRDKTPIPVEYVHPNVAYGTMAHKNFQPLDFQCPLILWTFDEVDDDGRYDEGRIVNLRASVSAYSSELYANDDRLPDNKAFVDLANLLERMYVELTKHHVINGVGIQKPIQYGIYDGVYYPYAYGWLTLKAEIARNEYEDKEIDEFC